MDIFKEIKQLWETFKRTPLTAIILIAVLAFLIYLLFYSLIIPSKDGQIALLKERIELLKEQRDDCRDKLNISPEAVKVKERFKQTVNTDYWKSQVFSKEELIQDYEGTYYIIDLKDVITNKTLLFQKGKYTINEWSKKFIESLNNFNDEVLKHIKGEVPYQIFVKGSADILGNETFKGYFEPDYKEGYRTIKYFGNYNQEKTKFISHYKTRNIPEPFTNEDLAFLRAQFIKKEFFERFDNLKEPIILDSEVVMDEGEEYRNATLLLYVKWPKE